MINQELLSELTAAAQTMIAPGKGILAADESFPTIEKRFAGINIPSTEDNRRAYRELLFTAPGIAEFISGAILFDETLRQNSASSQPLREILASEGILPGIKVDLGTEAMPGSSEEKVTKGLETLPQRLAEYKTLGAKFAKWRAVMTIGNNLPTAANLAENARLLAEYAAACQAVGIVPIVEPEVLMDGNHALARCEQVTRDALTAVFAALADKGAVLAGIILKPNMVISGKKSATQASSQEIADATLRVFHEAVPIAVPGIAFLSGGQSEQQATANLNEMNKRGASLPWALTFSYGRALQDSALKTWAGNPANTAAAQKVFLHRAKMNSLARRGQYRPELENS